MISHSNFFYTQNKLRTDLKVSLFVYNQIMNLKIGMNNFEKTSTRSWSYYRKR